MKKSFILHIDSLSILAKMPDDMAGKFIKLIYHFQLTGELLEMDFALEMAITPFINQFERDNSSYVKRCETNRTNGLNGGRPEKQAKAIKSEKTQSVNLKAKKAYNDNDSKNDNESVKDSNSDNDFKTQKPNFKNWTIEDFQEDIKENRAGYTDKDLWAFFNYWSEKDVKEKMKFQLQKTWETSKRLITWSNNNSKFTPKNNTQQTQKQEMGNAVKESLIFQLNKIKSQ